MANRTKLRLATTTFLIGLPGVAFAGGLPTGGTVAGGSATIASSGNATVITQSSQNAVINWQSFSVGQGSTVTFNDPNAQSATLNRVTGSATSTIAGQIISNGAVYLVNPNGIAITSTGAVQTGGGFVASTLGIADADFMAGRLNFAGTGASKTVTNAGKIIAGQGAYVALLGGAVSNAGTITVPLGRVGLGSGEQIALDLNGSGFMQVAVPTALVTGNRALVDNGGAIVVNGGRVTLSAAAVKGAVRNIIAMSGSINADSAVGDGGTITLIGGADTASMAGTVNVSGTLSARATGMTGNGGLVETSGETVDLTGANVITTAAHGKTGSWLIDPTDFTIAATGGDITGAALGAELANTNITIQSSQGASGTSGNINVNDAVSWASANTLTLQAVSNIAITSAITAGKGGLTLTAGGTITDTAAMAIGNFDLTQGNWIQNAANLPAFSATSFAFDPNNANFLRVTGGDGTSGTPYLIGDIYGLQGMGSQSLLSGNFALTNAIDARGTAQWGGGQGFAPINHFTGTFDGHGFTITGLVVDRPSSPFAGLFAVLGGSVSNLTIADAQISSSLDGGVLAAYVTSGTIANVATSGTVQSGEVAGGLIGLGSGITISNSSSSATVSAPALYSGGAPGEAGGLVGEIDYGSVTQSHATGNVVGGYAGGLAGVSYGSQITQNYATGTVTSTYAKGFAGGLVGPVYDGSITASYATGNVSGVVAGGLVGDLGSASTTGSASISQSYATGQVHGDTAGGLVGRSNAIGNSIEQVYATGAVMGLDDNSFQNLGGLIGYATSANVDQTYATGSVGISAGAKDGGAVGGLIGYASATTIAESYATGPTNAGKLAGTHVSGGLVGYLMGSKVTSSYWDIYSSSTTVGFGYNPDSSFSAVGITSDPAQASSNNYAYNSSAYSSFSPGAWVFFNGETRPFGAWELPAAVNGVVTITNSHQLQLVSTALGQGYILGANIDLTETGAVKAGTPASYSGMWSSAGFVPIGLNYSYSADNFAGTPFTGSFDGKGYVISNLYINLPDTYNVGLFSSLSGTAQINAAVLTSGRVTGGTFTGGLVGDILGGTSVTNSAFSGSVYGQNSGGSDLVDDTGGLIGVVYGPFVLTADRSSGTVSGMQAVGGLIGEMWGASLSKSASSATVYGTNFGVGGLVGEFDWGTIDRTSASGSVTGGGNVGGLVGQMGFPNLQAVLSNSYASGTVSNIPGASFPAYTGLGYGGLVGNTVGETIIDSYASGPVVASGVTGVGGLVGTNQYTPLNVVSSYYNADLNPGNGYGTGLTTAQMQNFAAYATTYTNWDFVNVWAPPSQAGQAGQATAYYPELYATSPVVFTTAAATSKTYGTDNPDLGTAIGGPGSYVFGPAGDSLSSASLFSTTATAASGVSQYAVTPVTGPVNSALGVVYRVIDAGTTGSLTINPAALTITYTANPVQSIYGSTPNPTGSYSEAGLVNGDTLNGSAIFTTTASNTSNVGNYGVTGSGLTASSNYTLSSVQAAGNATALTITPAPLTLTYTADAATSLYGSYGSAHPVVSGSVSGTGFVDGQTVSDLTGTAKWVTSVSATSNVGGYAITGSGLGDANYAITATQAAGNATAYSITPRPITVTAGKQTDIYGAATPSLTYVVGGSGLVNGDTLTGALSTSGTAGADVGSYAIAQGSLTAGGNYAITYVGANLTITPAPLTLTYTANAGSDIYGSYGSAHHTLTGSVAGSGFVDGQTVSDLTGTASWYSAANASSNVGSYGVTGSGMSDANYAITVKQAAANATAYQITARPITVTVNKQGITYGAAIAPLTYVVGGSGLVNGNTLTGALATTATASSNAGTYAITQGSLAAGGNYAITYVGANVTITPAPLTLTYTADAATSLYGSYGAAHHTVTGSVTGSGFVDGQTLANLTGTASWVTPVSATSNVGGYAITGSGLSSTNYAITAKQAAGNATAYSITPRTITVTAGKQSSVYGSAMPSLTYVVGGTGLVNGDTLTGALSTTASASSNVGAYAITQGSLAAGGNYIMTYVGANLTITPAPLTLTYTSDATTAMYGSYGSAHHTITGTVTGSGFVNGQTLAALSGTANWTSAVSATSNVGSYGVTGSGLSDANYAITVNQAAANGTAFQITARPITVTANKQTSTAGSAIPPLTYVVGGNGLVNGDTLSGGLATIATASSSAGTYAITQASLAASSNYTVTYVGANLTITAKP